MKYIQIRKDEIWTSGNTASLNPKTLEWEPLAPDFYRMNLRE